jgi:hypothetical protein
MYTFQFLENRVNRIDERRISGMAISDANSVTVESEGLHYRLYSPCRLHSGDGAVR